MMVLTACSVWRHLRDVSQPPTHIAAVLIDGGRPSAKTEPDGGAVSQCFDVWFDDIDPAQKTILAEATGAVCGVLNNPAFRQEIGALTETWDDGQGAGKQIAPAKLLSDELEMQAQPLHMLVGVVSGANAVTRPATWSSPPIRAIAIDKSRLAFWAQGLERRACLIDTIAHELTHLIWDGSTFRYQDRASQQVASYKFGNAVGCFALDGSIKCRDREMERCPGT